MKRQYKYGDEKAQKRSRDVGEELKIIENTNEIL
jgi:hypothetical protein